MEEVEEDLLVVAEDSEAGVEEEDKEEVEVMVLDEGTARMPEGGYPMITGKQCPRKKRKQLGTRGVTLP
jgi:hypothetical protein